MRADHKTNIMIWLILSVNEHEKSRSIYINLDYVHNSDLRYQKHKLSCLYELYVPDHTKLSPSGSSAQICKVSDYFVKTGK